MNFCREQKEGKILQYGERIWGITTGTVQEKVDQAIAKTVEYFEKMGLSTRLAGYGVSEATIDRIVGRFELRNFLLGENKNIDSKAVRTILEDRI